VTAGVEVRPFRTDDAEAVRLLLSENGWVERVADAEKFRAMMARSDRAVVAAVGAAIVGFARALCDGVSNGYLSMVVVAPEFRSRGIGRRLVTAIVGDDPDVTWVLRAGRPGAAEFWRRLGFLPSEVAMERVRRGPST
jgi:ribosomal protein S18 acetylase RimI-like enzyme